MKIKTPEEINAAKVFKLDQVSVLLDVCWKTVPAAVTCLLNDIEVYLRLLRAIQMYAHHRPECAAAVNPANPCTCGLKQTLENIQLATANKIPWSKKLNK